MNPIVKINHQALDRAFNFFTSLERSRTLDVLLLSPYVADFALVKRHLPGARIFVANVKTWDLNQPFPAHGTVDLVVCSNVFHYASDSSLWFKNVLSMTRFFMLQDLISRRRSGTPDGLCDDGDRIRYSYSARGIESDFTGAYDLTALDAQILYFDEFEGGRNEHYVPPASPRHYCAVIQSPYPSASRRLAGLDGLRFKLPSLNLAARAALRTSEL